jgi:hypothetical protein
MLDDIGFSWELPTHSRRKKKAAEDGVDTDDQSAIGEFASQAKVGRPRLPNADPGLEPSESSLSRVDDVSSYCIFLNLTASEFTKFFGSLLAHILVS